VLPLLAISLQTDNLADGAFLLSLFLNKCSVFFPYKITNSNAKLYLFLFSGGGWNDKSREKGQCYLIASCLG
jgi:hypothetical protein